MISYSYNRNIEDELLSRSKFLECLSRLFKIKRRGYSILDSVDIEISENQLKIGVDESNGELVTSDIFLIIKGNVLNLSTAFNDYKYRYPLLYNYYDLESGNQSDFIFDKNGEFSSDFIDLVNNLSE